MFLATFILTCPFWTTCLQADQAEEAIDPRIDPERITALRTPVPTEELTPPPPPRHRVTSNLDALPLPNGEASRFKAALDRGVVWLLDHQDEGGGWGGGAMAAPTNQPEEWPSPAAAAITGLGLKAVAQSGTDLNRLEPSIARLRRAARGDFGFNDGPLSNYVIATVTSGLASLDDSAYDDELREGVALLRRHQWDAGEGLGVEQDWYGGAGYGSRGRPDLSNTQLMLDALYDAGLPHDDLAFQRAVVFITRCQNLNATNPADWTGNDGGFVYTAAGGGESIASEAAGHGRHGDENLNGDGRSLRSYGSMTYAGYKSLLYAGVDQDDPRVKAALNWIRDHWTFESNPGLGQQGYYYYLYTMARALSASGLNEIITADGQHHNWRLEMGRAILQRQQDNGSWINSADRWLEGRRDLATIYAVLALEEILKPPILAMDTSSEKTTP